MKLFLFLDDWMIEAKRDIVRNWPLAKLADIPPYIKVNSYPSVSYDKYMKKYRCWHRAYLSQKNEGDKEQWRDAAFYQGIFYLESEDGLNFSPCNHNGPKDSRFDPSSNSISLPIRGGNVAKIQGFSSVYIDEFCANDNERYKAVSEMGFVFTSKDGLDWVPNDRLNWMKALDSDTNNNLIYNPINKCYQVFCRPRNLDRRIAMTKSDYFKDFSSRRVVLQPDIYDPPLHQFYGMKAFWYEDMFIGLLWDNFIPNIEPVIPNNLEGGTKMCGYVNTSLAYSYDGEYWIRGPRKPLLMRAEMPEYGWAGYYATSLVVGPDDVIKIYSQAQRLEHGAFKQQRRFLEQGEGDGAMRIHTMRKDGFSYLESVGSYGWFSTRGLIPKDGDLKINVEAPLGELFVQVSDKSGKPYPGFSFEECIPIKGDELAAVPQWKEKKLKELTGKYVRLEFKLFQARLYAFRWDCMLHYGLEPQERI